MTATYKVVSLDELAVLWNTSVASLDNLKVTYQAKLDTPSTAVGHVDWSTGPTFSG
jgi:hypothetical protein